MKAISIRKVLIGLFMIIAAWGGFALKPTKYNSKMLPKIDLENMIPQSFDDWRVDESIIQVLPDPKLLKVLNDTFSQTISRTYVNKSGHSVMLSIAYGGVSHAMQYHRPEVCYPSQGFEILDSSRDVLKTSFGEIPITRISTKLRDRSEPVTYWVSVGGESVKYGFSMRWIQLKHNLTGTIPEGILVRFSTIGSDALHEYAVQDAFAKEMLSAMKPSEALRLTGISQKRRL